MSITLKTDQSPYAYQIDTITGGSVYDVMSAAIGCASETCMKKVVVWYESPQGTWHTFDSTRPKELNSPLMLQTPAPTGIYTFYNYTGLSIVIAGMSSLNTATHLICLNGKCQRISGEGVNECPENREGMSCSTGIFGIDNNTLFYGGLASIGIIAVYLYLKKK